MWAPGTKPLSGIWPQPALPAEPPYWAQCIFFQAPDMLLSLSLVLSPTTKPASHLTWMGSGRIAIQGQCLGPASPPPVDPPSGHYFQSTADWQAPPTGPFLTSITHSLIRDGGTKRTPSKSSRDSADVINRTTSLRRSRRALSTPQLTRSHLVRQQIEMPSFSSLSFTETSNFCYKM